MVLHILCIIQMFCSILGSQIFGYKFFVIILTISIRLTCAKYQHSLFPRFYHDIFLWYYRHFTLFCIQKIPASTRNKNYFLTFDGIPGHNKTIVMPRLKRGAVRTGYLILAKTAQHLDTER